MRPSPGPFSSATHCLEIATTLDRASSSSVIARRRLEREVIDEHATGPRHVDDIEVQCARDEER